ncbi:MAG TPA: tetratricopeptide repeat protein [Nitrospirota bacterium]|nr:tetratricopeptide repeat protein [Nitrospirota bacterium]
MPPKQPSVPRRDPPLQSRLNRPFIHGALLVLIGLAVYSNTFSVPFQFDDPSNITDNPIVRDIGSFLKWEAATQPRSLTYFTFALNYRLHGTGVAGYHIVNLAIHIINALLVYWLISLCFRTPPLRQSLPRLPASTIAFFAALLFISHPVQTQAVTYIVQRLASLAALFSLASLTAYLKWRLADSEPEASRGRWAWYALSLFCAVLAMKSKETAFTLPLLIVLVEFLFFAGNRRRRTALLLPFLFTLVIIPLSMLKHGSTAGELIGDVSAATRLATDLTRSDYLLTEFTVITTYLRLLFLPMNQNLDYDYPVYRSLLVPEVAVSLLLLASIVAGALFLLRQERRRTSPGRLVAFGILWFFVTLSVESSVIPIADVIFEHRLYLPSVGFFLSLTTALFWGAERLKSRWAFSERALVSFLAVAVVLCGVLGFRRNMIWQTETGMWEDVIQKSPEKARGYNGLGLAYLDGAQYEAAARALTTAVSLYPTYGSALNNLGSAWYHLGNLDRAVEAQTKAIAVEPNNAVFRDGRGVSLTAMGSYDRAIEDFTHAIALDPAYAKAYHNLGAVYHREGLYLQAIEEYTRAISLAPDNDVFYTNRGLAYAQSGDTQRALEDYSHALHLNPKAVYAYSGRGEVYGRLHHYDEAIADFTRAMSLDPTQSLFHLLRGIAYQGAGRRADALADFAAACEKGNERGCNEVQRNGGR